MRRTAARPGRRPPPPQPPTSTSPPSHRRAPPTSMAEVRKRTQARRRHPDCRSCPRSNPTRLQCVPPDHARGPPVTVAVTRRRARQSRAHHHPRIRRSCSRTRQVCRTWWVRYRRHNALQATQRDPASAGTDPRPPPTPPRRPARAWTRRMRRPAQPSRPLTDKCPAPALRQRAARPRCRVRHPVPLLPRLPRRLPPRLPTPTPGRKRHSSAAHCRIPQHPGSRPRCSATAA